MNTFDRLKRTAFNVVTRTMGYDAIWYVDADLNGRTFKAKVLFNSHSKQEDLGDHTYGHDRPIIEFKTGDFKGLKASVDAGNNALIYVCEKFYYGHLVVAPKDSAKDGDTYILIMNEADEYNNNGR